MPPALTLQRALTSWRVDVPTLVAFVLLGAGYLRAAARAHPAPRRTVAFLAGLATAVLVTCSFLGVYDRTLFWVRAVQNVVLLMGVPLLLALGSPVRLALDAAPTTLAARLRLLGRPGPGADLPADGDRRPARPAAGAVPDGAVPGDPGAAGG